MKDRIFFSFFDFDLDGKIDSFDVNRIATNLEQSEYSQSQILGYFDLDNNSYLDFLEFDTYMEDRRSRFRENFVQTPLAVKKEFYKYD